MLRSCVAKENTGREREVGIYSLRIDWLVGGEQLERRCKRGADVGDGWAAAGDAVAGGCSVPAEL